MRKRRTLSARARKAVLVVSVVRSIGETLSDRSVEVIWSMRKKILLLGGNPSMYIDINIRS